MSSTFPILGDCEGCKFYDGRGYDGEPCCYCQRNVNVVDEYEKEEETTEGDEYNDL